MLKNIDKKIFTIYVESFCLSKPMYIFSGVIVLLATVARTVVSLTFVLWEHVLMALHVRACWTDLNVSCITSYPLTLSLLVATFVIC